MELVRKRRESTGVSVKSQRQALVPTEVWYTTPIDASAASNIPPDSAMTCFGLYGTKSRVYAINAMGDVVEIGWSGNNQWYSVDVGALARAPRAAHGSAISCLGVDGKATRVYYFASSRIRVGDFGCFLVLSPVCLSRELA
jgi:hypothetical protein